MFWGSRRWHSSTMVSTVRTASPRFMQKKSLLWLVRSGITPWLTPWAFMTMALSWAWRKISVRATPGTTWLRSRWSSTLPGPTEGSWSGSPTSTRRQSPRMAASRADIRDMSTMEVSSTMTASTPRGSSWFLVKASCPV